MFNCTTIDDLLTEELVKELSISYGTPLYVYFERIIRERAKIVMDIFNGINIFPTFACKANNNPNLIKIMYDEGFGTDIVTLGEYHASKLAGVPDEKILWNGNGKTSEEMAILSKVRYVNVDSFDEFERWKEIKKRPELFLRINPDVDPKTHPHISTGLKKNKFGILLEDVKRELDKSEIRNMISGFHIHIGSQITDVEPFRQAISQVVEISKKYGFSKINIGGGWGISYEEKELDISEYKKSIVPLLQGFEQVILELGRYIVAPAGALILKVEYVKKTSDKTFVVVNGGMNLLIRPTLYNAYHGIKVFESSDEKRVVDVVGPLCESGDVIAINRTIEVPRVDSYVVIENVGAYGYSMSSNYNSTLRPAEVLITEEKKPRLIRRRETIEDLFRTVI